MNSRHRLVSAAERLRRSAVPAMSAATFIALAGCASPPSDGPRLPQSLPANFSGTADTVGDAVDQRWWTSFGDDRLNGLIAQALVASQDIGVAMARVRVARAGLDAQASRMLPTIGVQASASRSQTGLPEAVKQAGEPDTRAWRAGLGLAWEVDLAGGVRAARNAAGADAQAAQAGVAGARLLVASEVARQYFILRGAQEKLRLVEALASAQRETARLTASREREGQASRFDLTRAQAEAESFDAQVPPLRSLVGSTRNRLAVLLGEVPVKVDESGAPYVWPAPKAIAAGQPTDLLRRRPDLMAAEQHFDAETLRGNEARADLWPKVFLEALLGREGLRLNALDWSPVRFSSIAVAFTMPLLNRGRVLAGIEAQSARADEALLNWQKAVLIAVEEVEDSLLLRDQETRRAVSLQAAVRAQRLSLAHAQSLRREGQIDLLALLDVQRALLASELALADSQSQQALDDVQLYKALGGGWAADVPAQPPGPAIRTSQLEGIQR